jgi:hypothetical protein
MYPRALSQADSFGIRAAEQVLAAGFLPGLDGDGVDHSRPLTVADRYRFRPSLTEMTPRSPTRPVLVSVPLSSTISSSWANIRAPHGGVPMPASGL